MQTLERKSRVRFVRGTVHLGRPDAALGDLPVFMDGTGKCTVCNSCSAYNDDGSGLYKCKCGDRKADHE